ncbi:unknown [Bacteroides sp. CAG:20]|nr:unknown [Bacteroides sp. CAG:20]
MPNMKIHLRPEMLFFVQYDPKATWFGQSKPAFRGKRIFLQKQNMPPLKNASIVLFE